MKILLAQNMFYVPAHGGAVKANRLLLEALAARGHECRAVATISGGHGRRTLAQFHDDLAARGIAVDSSAHDVVVFRHRGVEVHAVAQTLQLGQQIAEVSRAFKPDVVLVPSDEPGMMTLSAALEANPGRVIYLAHTMQHLPFGPRSFLSNETGAALLRQAAGIITVSRAIQAEIRRWGGLESVVLPFPAYGPGPFPDLHRFDAGYVTLINPCAYKGLPIFLDLARTMPDVQFAAVPTWGTTPADREALAMLPNIRLLPPADEIDEIFAQTRALLAPSLWDETFGLVTVEAMLRGIPVLASNVGGLVEAKLGVDYVLPVQPIERYQISVDQHLLPLPVTPEQDITPWAATLRELLTDRSRYERVAQESRAAAHAFVAAIAIEPFEAYLHERTRGASAASAAPAPTASAANNVRSRVEQLSPERQALLARMLKQKSAPAQRGPEIPQLPRTGEPQEFECSSGQKRLWLIQRIDPDGAAYNSVMAYRVSGKLDRALLERSFDQLIRRHESLRTTFIERDGEPFQVVNPPWSMRIVEHDLRGLPADQREAAAGRIARDANRTPYALERGPLVRAALLHMADDSAIFMFGLHHIISDGWSMGTFQRELSELYNAEVAGREAALPPLTLQCADVAVWQNQQMRSPTMEPHIEYWLRKLADPLPTLELPTDRPQPAYPTQNGAFQFHPLPQPLVEAIGRLSRQEGATPFMTFLAAFKIMLARYTGQDDLVIGTVIANRTHAALEPLVAFLANTLVLRTSLHGNPSFREALARVRETASEAYQHQDLLFALLVEKLNPMRDMNRNPLFDVTFGYHNVPPQQFTLDGATAQAWRVPNEVSSMPLTMDLIMTPEGLHAQIEYSTDLFDAATIERMFHHYVTLLEGVAANPNCPISELPLLTPAELERTLTEWAGVVPGQADAAAVHRMIEAQAAANPAAVAVLAGDQSLSYGELDRRANRLARYLQQAVGGRSLSEVHIGICLDRTPALVAAVLAVLKAGGAYVPLDPSHAPERLQFLIADSRAELVIAERATAAALAQAETTVIVLEQIAAALTELPSAPLPTEVDPDSAAYVIYTSGSTGAPKGVVVTHGGLSNAYLAYDQAFQLRATTTAHLQMANITFDVFSADLIRALCSGARLALCPRELLLDAPRLFALIERHAIDCAEFVPVVIRELMQYLRASGRRLDQLRVLMVSSDSWFVRESQELLRFCGPQTRLINTYGLTEATIDSTFYDVGVSDDAPDRIVPIGRPLSGSRVYVLDSALRPTPAIVPGELYIGGAGVARGYWNRPALTAERFIPNPFRKDEGGGMKDASGLFRLPPSSLILYKTGDLARWLPDGTIELLGRADHQVKVRGFRIELGEIEAALRQHPALRDVAVIAQDDARGEKLLIAYIVGTQPPALGELRAFLRARLPEYMIPALFVTLDALPISNNGKIDRRALPIPETLRPDLADTFVAPRSVTEEALVEIWGGILQTERIGVYDNFFELGGHSLLATRLVVRIRDAFEVDLPLRTVFELPTPAEQAEAIEARLLAEIAEMPEAEAERLVASL
jgi:amino acid adenylation domain-containing protein